ncbi:hypothetical protein RFI36_19615 [Acinetobacter gerneri]|uniref:Uncharacterized protein n=1 Tax=Acinetobacter gerneri TaxID=202952 RepID=A0AAW8JLI1_9GAMM|nr:hypothetical protein [Acinetobacter gerneri]MDQ9011924.1 hypothetical protein [Acinetobacter gerneri]MDQ9016029.1 hypothetical protein [Acinetobacter gerneri]MDQ9027200.1 hypothetical protein [Acinetobacter gerneri]MDQ9054500.1 hypothetical protein [Acinetobacter gerneri]MDQ9062151.1 hypothetical protein [Acinetobacter gerneri]
METAFDFNEEFGTPKKLLCKNFNKIQISIHPSFSGIYLCYQEAFKSLKADLSILTPYPELRVWKDPNIVGYTIVNACQWHLYASQNMPKNIKLLIHSFPQDEEKVELLKKVASSEFIKFLYSYHHDLNRINPEKLKTLINNHICSEIILALNKESSFKPHCTMSLDLLAKLLSYTRNQLNYRNKVINLKRQNVLDQLQQTSGIVQQLLNNVDFVLTPDQLWKA